MPSSSFFIQCSRYPVIDRPDLIGVADRRYLDRTGSARHRNIGDLMRYASLAQGIEFIGPIHGEDDDYKWTHFRAPDGFVYELTYSTAHPSIAE